MCLGKALGGGAMPIGALLGTERVLGEIDDVPDRQHLGVATRRVRCGHCDARRLRIRTGAGERGFARGGGAKRCGELRDRHEEIGDVRAEGCLQAIEFVTDRETANLDSVLQHAVAAEMVSRGVLADSSSTSVNIQPSLVMPPAALEDAYDIIGAAIDAVLTASR